MKRRSRTVFKLGRHKWEQVGDKWQPVLKEEHVVREIVERLWFQGRIKVWRIRERIPGIGAPSTAGIPDLIGFVPKSTVLSAIPLFLEVKKPGGARRPAQERFIEEAVAGGCIAGFCESWSDVVSLLKPFGIELKEAA